MRIQPRHHKLLIVALVLASYFLLLPSGAKAATIWKEGEDAAHQDVTRNSWYDSVKPEVLSGGQWISHFDGNKPGLADYDIDAPEDGDYVFWVRANPLGTKLAYSLDKGAYTEIDLAKDQRGNLNIAVDDKPDLRFIAWAKVGNVKLTKGAHIIGFKMHSDNSNHGAIDCFVLTTDHFIPSGKNKPGEGAGGKETPADPKDAIWIEGENPTHQDMHRHPWWYDKVKKEVLSGNDFISNFSDKVGTADYDFDVITDDTYTFWVRANPQGTSLKYKLDTGEWTPIDLTKDVRGQLNIADDDKPDLRFICWAKVGQIKLAPGKHNVAFKMDSGNSNCGMLDCFVFTRIPFTPSGVNKPSVKKGGGGPGDWFSVVADEDAFSKDSVIDLSSLVEAPAGNHGFLKADGEHLKFEKDTEPTQFWGCGANVGDFTADQQLQRARYLRKYGIRIVRTHAVFDQIGPMVNGDFDAGRLDAFDKYFAAFRSQGIYMDFSVFYTFAVGKDDGYDPALFAELDDVNKDLGTKNTYGVITTAPDLFKLRFKYMKALLLHKNPYTKLRYIDDPALAVLEFQNEDSVFFHNPLTTMAAGQKWPLHTKSLQQRWCAWVKNKYQTDDAVAKAWGGLQTGESLNNGVLQAIGAWALGEDGPKDPFGGKLKRAADYIQFLTEMQRGLYEWEQKQLVDLGYKGVTVTTAWQVGGPASDPANLYTDCAGDMIDRHNYAGGGAGNYSIAVGDINNPSMLAQPGGSILSSGFYQVENKPFSMSEWTESPPNQWKSECAPLMAYYGMGLQGWDTLYHFMNGHTRIGDGWPELTSFTTDTPSYIGQFPALAFATYHHHIKQGPVIAARRITKGDLFTGTDALHQDFTGGGYDIKALKGELRTPVEALAIGRVTTSFDGGKSDLQDLSPFWDHDKKIVKSNTGELTWDYASQLVTLDTGKSAGIVGKAEGRTVELKGVHVEQIKTPFMSLLFTPMDDLPLSESKNILVTAMARDMQTGTQYSDDGKKLIATGGPPLLMEPVQVTIKIAGAIPAAVKVLDIYGVPTGKTVPVKADGSLSIDGTYQTYYYQITR